MVEIMSNCLTRGKVAKNVLLVLVLFTLVLTILPQNALAGENRQVNASEILDTIEKGKLVDEENCIIIGDLDLSKINLSTIKVDGRELRRVNNSISIKNSIIKGDVNFNGIYFNGSVNFEKSVFSGSTSFDNASFDGKANFGHTRFNHTKFYNTTFKSESYFSSAEFNDWIQFDRANFSQKAMFIRTRFNNGAQLFNVFFNNESTFHLAIFNGLIQLSVSIFTTLGILNNWKSAEDHETWFHFFALIEALLGWIIVALFVISLTMTWIR